MANTSYMCQTLSTMAHKWLLLHVILRSARHLCGELSGSLNVFGEAQAYPFQQKVKLLNTTCVTILLYGCKSWVVSQDMECKINAFATSCNRITLGIRRRDHVTNSSIYSMTNSEPLVYCVRKRQLRFLGHVIRLPEDEPARIPEDMLSIHIPPHGKRRPGRPRTSLISYINHV